MPKREYSYIEILLYTNIVLYIISISTNIIGIISINSGNSSNIDGLGSYFGSFGSNYCKYASNNAGLTQTVVLLNSVKGAQMLYIPEELQLLTLITLSITYTLFLPLSTRILLIKLV